MTLRLPLALTTDDDDQAVAALRRYFADDKYSGGWFDTWDTTGSRGADQNRFTADDIVAVSCLGVDVPAGVSRRLLAQGNNTFNGLLALIGPDRDLADDQGCPLASDPAWQLDRALRGLSGVGRTIGSKLMARKRPRLVPIYDSVVADVMKTVGGHWVPLWRMLRADNLRLQRRLLRLRALADLPPEVSALRTLDVVAWMQGSIGGQEIVAEGQLP